jgi:hypothetical protein
MDTGARPCPNQVARREIVLSRTGFELRETRIYVPQ